MRLDSVSLLLPVLIGAVCATAGPARAQAPGEASAVRANDCDRACLIATAWRYVDALVRHDPARAPISPDARFSENDVMLRVGHEGLWASIDSASPHALTAADTRSGNVAWFGSVTEHGVPAYAAIRLKVTGRRITEIESVVERKPGLPAPFGDPDRLVHDAAFDQVLSPPERRERERLRDVANGYFSTIARNDGELLTRFDPDCQRIENGISTTRGSFGSAKLAQGCEAQLRLGYFRINKRVRDRRFPIIDEERGVVVATGFFDHDNSVDRYRTTDGREHRTLLKWPNSLSLMEAFKIRNGQIFRVEAIFTYVPYFMPSPWVDPARGSSSAPGAVGPVAAADHAGASESACDRSCLIGLADDYMRALAAHDPARLPWAERVRYSENSVAMDVGDGQWASVTAASREALHAADPAKGEVAWLGLVQEHGQPAYYGMRMTVRNGRIAAVAAVIDGKGMRGPFGDPQRYAHDPAFDRVEPAGSRRSRAELTALADGYFSTLQRNDGTLRTRFAPDCERNENGESTTSGVAGNAPIAHGCEAQFRLGLFAFDEAVRDRQFPLIDEERGVVVAMGYIDHPARFVNFRSTDGHERTSPFTSPDTLGLIEAFKIVEGRIYRVEAIFSELPYRMPPP